MKGDALRLAALGAIALTLGGAAPDPRARLRAANAAAEAADARARALAAAAIAARDTAQRARIDQAAVATRIRAAEQRLIAAQARVAIVERLLAERRARLAERQAPIERLVAALQSLARRPAAVALVQPGSLDDIVHVRAALGALVPEVRARTQAVRAEITAVRALRGDARLAATSLRDGRSRLERERLALVRLEATQRLRGADLARGALVESDRALALGEQARDLVDRMAADELAAVTAEGLALLPGPLLRPDDADPPAAAPPAYRLPVRGRLVAGLGELSTAGVRSRGLAIVTRPDAAVFAPAAGRIVFARPFRSYGIVVVIDHGEGWTTALTGLGRASIAVGDSVAAGAPIGRAGAGEEPEIGVELRRRDVPMDVTRLIG